MLLHLIRGTEIYDRYVKPRLTVEEYQLYSDSKTYVSIVDPRFRLAAHNLNIEELSAKLGRRFMLDRGWQNLQPSPVLFEGSFEKQEKEAAIFRFSSFGFSVK